MKIHFCDLCNESVPQSELDEGRAFMRKGRVVCVKCDQLMTQREASHGAQPTAGADFFGTGSARSAQLETLAPPAAVAAGIDAGPGAQHHHHPRMDHARAQGSGAGVAFAMLAILLSALGGYWLMDRTDKIHLSVNDQIQARATTQLEVDKRATTRLTDLDGRMSKLEEGFTASLDNEHKAIEARLIDAQARLDKALIPLGDLKADLAGLKAMVPSIQRHDQELFASAQKIAELESRANAVDSALLDLKKQLEARPSPVAAGPAARPATPVGTPAWMDKVKELESSNSGDRWVAVQALGETRDPAVTEYLLPRLKDVDIFVRMATARVLGDLGSPKAIGALIEALNDQDSSVREAAYVSLCGVSKKSLPFDAHQEPAERAKRIKAWEDWWKKAQESGAAQ